MKKCMDIPESTYIHDNEINQFIHIQVPMELVVDDCFAKLSGDAKILYGLLLNRTGLSIRNGWKDNKGRTFIYYTVEDVMADMHVSHCKASKMFSELSNFMKNGVDDKDNAVWLGLIEKVRVPNKPSRIYVHKVHEIKLIAEHIMSGDKELEEDENDDMEDDNGNTSVLLMNDNDCEHKQSADISDIRRRTSQNGDDGHLKNRMTDISDLGRRTSQNTDENNNNIIYNNMSNNNPPPSCSDDREVLQIPESDDVMERMAFARELIKDNVEYPALISSKYVSQEQVDELIEIMVEACVLLGDIEINGMKIPHKLLQSRFEKYDRYMMENALSTLAGRTVEVKNVKKYLLAILYNAALTRCNQVKLQVQHDMNTEQWAGFSRDI